jgi:hypothetical protein
MAADWAPEFFLLKYRLTAEQSAALLGRVVKRYEDPNLDYTPVSDGTELARAKHALAPQYDHGVALTATASRDDRVGAKIKGLLGLSVNTGKGGSTTIKSPRVTVRRLTPEKDYFKALKELPEVRTKILDMCPWSSKTAYLVVGTMSFRTAEISRTGESHRNRKLETTVPVGQLAAAAASAPVGGHTGDAQLDLERSRQAEWTTKFTTAATGPNGEPEEHAEEVFAICCKEIGRDWLGLGKGVQMKPRQVEYRSGQHFKGDDEDEDDEDDDDEGTREAAEGLQLLDEPAFTPRTGHDKALYLLDSGISIHL